MMKKTIITLILALSVIMADEPGCLNDSKIVNENIERLFFYLTRRELYCERYNDEHCYIPTECYQSFKQACDKGKDKSGKFCYATGLYGLVRIGEQPEKYLKKACEKNKDYCDYEEKFYKAKIDSVEGEDYGAYLTKGSIAFNAKKYKQAENYFRKVCEKVEDWAREIEKPPKYMEGIEGNEKAWMVIREGLVERSVFGDFPKNCNAHTVMDRFCKLNNPYKDYRDYTEFVSCMKIGDIYYEGNKELQVKRNIPLAKKYWAMAAEFEGYHRIKENAKADYTIDYIRERLVAESACGISGAACETLGDIYAQSKGVKQDLAKAKDFYKKACENPIIDRYTKRVFSQVNFDYLGCEKLGNLYYLENNFVEAKKWWTKAVGGVYDRSHPTISKDTKKCSETDTIKGICEKLEMDMCYTMECKDIIDIERGYFKEAEGYYKGYAVKEGEYDYKTDNWIETTTIPHEIDYNKAFILASIGCDDFADSKSCYLLAKAYTEGKGTKQDSNLAQHYLKKGNKYEARELYNGYHPLFDGKTLLEKICKLDSESEACTDLKEKRYYEPEGTK